MRVAVIGAGYWGKNVVRELLALNADVELTVCDRDLVQRDWAEALNLRTAKTAAEVLGDDGVSAVFICTPIETHAELALNAALSGKHVFVEKPMATSPDAARELLAAAEGAGTRVFVGHVMLYHPCVAHIRDWMAAHPLEVPLSITTERGSLACRRKDALAWDLAPHDVSLVRYLLDETHAAGDVRAVASVVGGHCAAARAVQTWHSKRPGAPKCVATMSWSSRWMKKRASLTVETPNYTLCLDDSQSQVVDKLIIVSTTARGPRQEPVDLTQAWSSPLAAELAAAIAYFKGEGDPPPSAGGKALDVVRDVHSIAKRLQ